MSKDAVRSHIADRFEVREKYLAAYATWESLHDKWAFGIYRIMRTLIKSQEQAALERRARDGAELDEDADMDDDTETVLGDDFLDRASQAATEFDEYAIGESDTNCTVLTTLQDGAEADEQDRMRRWFTSQHKRYALPESPDKSEFSPLRRSGPQGAFGMGVENESSSRKRPRTWRTPSIDFHEKSMRRMPDSRPGGAPSDMTAALGSEMLLDDEDDYTMSDAHASESDDEAEDHNPWRIYSEKCSCGYAGCHCKDWARWWDKTLDMLDYVEYVDVPMRSSLGGDPDAPPRFARLCPGEEPLPAGYGRSSLMEEKPESLATGKCGWVYDRFASSKTHVKARYENPIGLE